MAITRGEFLRSLGKSLPGMVASTGVATAAQAIFKRVSAVVPPETPVAPASRPTEDIIPFLERGPSDTTSVALTFDDGPVFGVTERILDALRAHQIHATFFMIGERVAAAPDLARRVLHEGHELGHHTYTHRKLTELPDAEVEAELDKTSAIFDEVFGVQNKPAWFRPPFGSLRQDQARRVRARNMAVAMWSVDAEDWREGPGEEVTERILTRVHPGAIILCHDTKPEAESIETTLKRFRDDTPFRLGTLGELVRVAIP